MDKKKLRANIRRVIREHVGFTPVELRGYVIDPTLSEVPADDAVDLDWLLKLGADGGKRQFAPGCAVDFYVYTIYDKVDGSVELDCNVRVEFGVGMRIVSITDY